MQKKFPYSVLKWTLLLGVASSLATACVVTSGDGTDISFGGEGNNTTDGGEPSSGGSTSTAGKGGSGGSTSTAGKGGSGTAGTMAAAGGEGGTAAAYMPGVCDSDTAVPSMKPECKATSGGDKCEECLKAKCCNEWQECNATEPASACSAGAKAGDPGQFACIHKCFLDGAMNATNADDLLAECAGKCVLQCDTDGAILNATSDIVGCANDPDMGCQAECFPFN